MFRCWVRRPWSSSKRELLSLARRILTACTLMRSLCWRYFTLYNYNSYAIIVCVQDALTTHIEDLRQFKKFVK